MLTKSPAIIDDCLDDELDVSNYLDDDLDDGLVVNCSSPSDEGPFIGRMVQPLCFR